MLSFDNPHYYDILEVGNNVTRKEITASYSRLVKEYNPDRQSFRSPSLKQQAQEKFELINEAYQTLRNPIKRAEYDAFLDDFICEDVVDVDTETKDEYCDYESEHKEGQPDDNLGTPKTQPHDTKVVTPASEKLDSTSQPSENRKKMNYIFKHWRGELSLAISFWVNYFLIQNITTFLINWFAQSSPIDHPVISARVTIIIVIIIFFIYIWQIVGLWRACNRHVAVYGKAFWARTVQTIVVLGLIAVLGSVTSYWGIYKDIYQLGFQKDTTPAYSLTLREDGSLIHLKGGLRFGVSKDVAAILKDHPDAKRIILDCDGGWVYEGRELSKLILIYGLDTYSLEGCYSAGTIAFISGTNRFLGTEANLGFHQYSMDYESLRELADLEGEQEEDLRIFKRKGIKKEFLEKLYDVSAEDLWYPSIDELLGAGVIHGVVNTSDLIPVEYQESIEDFKEEFLDVPVYRTIQKYEPEVFEQIIANMDKQLKKGATFLEMKNALARDTNALAFPLIPRSSNNTLIRFSQFFSKSLKKLVEIDPILGLKYIYPEQYGSFVSSDYFSGEELAQGDDIFNDIIIDAYEKESPQVDIEAAELLIQKIAPQLGDDAEYVDIDLKELQNSDQYKRHCDALVRTYELILVEDKKFAANVLRYMFAQAATDGSREWVYTDAQGNLKFQTEADRKLNDVTRKEEFKQEGLSSKEQSAIDASLQKLEEQLERLELQEKNKSLLEKKKETEQANRLKKPDGDESNLFFEKYYNQSDYYSISLPTSWEKEENYSGVSVMAIRPLESRTDTFRENVNVYIHHKLTKGMSLDQYFHGCINAAQDSMKNFVKHKDGNQIINGLASKFVICSHSHEKQRVKFLAYLIVSEGKGYQITFTATPETFGWYKMAFEKMAKTFKIEKE